MQKNKELISSALIAFCLIALGTTSTYAQTGQIIESGDQVLDPNLDGYVSLSNAGFSGDGYDVDEFEIKMFGIPIFGDGEALNDVQSGKDCGVVDIALDTAGYGLYAGYDNNENLIFRFRLGSDQKSVQSYSVFIDTDQLIGTNDPNANGINPGFEIEITLIQRFGVYIYGIDGQDSCPTPLKAYSVATHQQKSITGTESCDDPDIYIDFYVPFSDLESLFGITTDTNLRFAGVTNISATCALDGSISDIGGVDDNDYGGCFSCAILDLTENQCPSSVSNLCETCAGFPLGATQTPVIDLPVIVGDEKISGTAEEYAEIYISLFSSIGVLLDQDTVSADMIGIWESTNFNAPLNFGDSVVVNALLPGKCESGALDTGLSFAIVSPNQPPSITGSGLSKTYIENNPPMLVDTTIVISDDNTTLQGATVRVSANLEVGFDMLEATTSSGIVVAYDIASGTLTFSGEATTSAYQQALRSVKFYSSSEAPSLAIRSISFRVNDGMNLSPIYSVNILITQKNDPPVIVIGTTPVDTIYVTTNEDVPVPICIDGIDVDLDDLAISNLTVKDGNGSATLDQGLCATFTPVKDFTGKDFVEIVVCDDGTPALCDTVIAVIDVLPVNDPPVIINNNIPVDSLFFTIEQTSKLEFCLDAYDIENDNLIVEDFKLTTSNGSTLSWKSDLCFEFSPNITFVGIEQAEITICDSGSPSRCTVLYVEIKIEDANFPPSIISTTGDTLYVETNRNTSAEICLDTSDPDNDELDFGTISNLLGVGGSTDLSFSCLNYLPELNYVGVVLLDVQVCDDVTPAKCDNIIIKINVLPFNNPPNVIVDTQPVDTVYFYTDVNTRIDMCLDIIDPDNDNVLISDLVNNTGSGILETDGETCISYTPDPDSPESVWTTVTICDDGVPAKCTQTVIGINITPLNDPPVITFNGVSVDTLHFETTRNTAIDFCIEANDINNDILKIESINELDGGGFYQPGNGDLCVGFVPLENFIGQTVHLIKICDSGSPQGCDSVYVKVDVREFNNPPQIFYNSVETDTVHLSTLENLPVSACLSVSDSDGDLITLSELGIISGEGSNNYVQNGAEYCVEFTPALGFFGDAYLRLNFCDNGLPTSCTNIILHVEVINVNNSPEVYQNGVVLDTIRFSTPARTSLSACIEVIDKDGDELDIELPPLSKESGILEVSDDLCDSSTPGQNFLVSYTPEQNFLGLDYFEITVCDNQNPQLCATVTAEVDVYSINEAPYFMYENEITDTILLTGKERQNTNIAIEVIDANEVQISSSSLEEGVGALEVSLTSKLLTIDYTPDILSNGEHKITVSVCDDGLPVLCSSIVVNLDIAKEEIFPFEAISPNGDNLNDFWMIQGIEHYPDNSVFLFDRWNNLVFSIDSYNNTDRVWKGETNNGLSKSDVKDGTYFYKITLSPDGEVLSGMVVVKR